MKRLITYETRYSLPNVNGTHSPIALNRQHVQDHFEKLYRTTTEATKARNSARLKEGRKENDDPYDPDKFDRIRIDELAVGECVKKEYKQGNQPKRVNQKIVAPKTCDNGSYILLDSYG